MLNVITLSQNLIKYPSITPDNIGTIDYLHNCLKSLGFNCKKLIFNDPIYKAPVHNLYAKIGEQGSNFCFAGHTDVVSVGETSSWSVDPFAGTIIGDKLYGRGSSDMKCAIACFIAAIAENINSSMKLKNSISLLITGDEEKHATNGTAKVLEYLQQQQEKIDFCLIGEPSNPNFLGEMIKIGRRGSLNATLEIYGLQGHVAYPEYAHNPIKDFIKAFKILTEEPLDHGNQYFQPSNLEFTSIDIGNDTCNMIPNKVVSKFNVRFNNNYNISKIINLILNRLEKIDINYNLTNDLGSEPFINFPQEWCNVLSKAVHKITNHTPILGTIGGTSDARFIQNICPVVEFGLIGKTAHQIDEHVLVQDVYSLKDIYAQMIRHHLTIDPNSI